MSRMDCPQRSSGSASSAALTAQCSPYPGAKPMRLVDVEDRDALADLVERVRAEL